VTAETQLTPGRVVVMATACAFAVATLYYSQPLLPMMGASFGHSPAEAGLIATLTQIGYALGLVLFVPLGDRLNRKALILSLLSANMIGLAACALAPGFILLLVASLGVGLTAVTAQIVIPAVSSLASPENRGRTIGTLLSGLSAGLLLARTVSGLVGTYLGWRAMFGLSLLLDGGLMLIIWRLLPTVAPTSNLSYPRLLASLGGLILREPVLRRASLIGFLLFASFNALWGTLAALLARPPFGFAADAVGAFGLVGLAGLLASPVIGRLSDRFGTGVMVTAGALSVFACFVLVAGTESQLLLLVAAMILLDVGNRAAMVANQSRIYSLNPDERSRLNTVYMGCYFLGAACGSALGALAGRAWGWNGLAVLGAVLALAALAVHALSARKIDVSRREP